LRAQGDFHEKKEDAIDTTKLDEAYALERLGIQSPKNTLINLVPDTHHSDFEIQKYYCGGIAAGCEEECKGHKIVKDVYQTLKNNDELKDLGHTKEDFVK
jgi:hypothetical protein